MESKNRFLRSHLDSLGQMRRDVRGTSAFGVIASVLGIIVMLYIGVLLLDSVESSIDQDSLSTSMNTTFVAVQNNTVTSMNLASIYPVVIIAGAMIAAFLGFTQIA